MASGDQDAREAADLARRAEEAAARLKVGTWESVQALALLSIAKSLSAAATTRSDQG